MQKKPAKVPVHRPPPPKHVRIIGGAWKRSQLPVLDALGLRPTPDRVRETVYNWISHLWDHQWQTARVLDLFAGSGALGLEAASRGAAAVTLIDSHPQVVRQLGEIKDKLHADNVTVQRADALAAAATLAARGARYDLVFLDPPYQQDLLSKSLPLCLDLLDEDGLVYVESGTPLPFPQPETVDAPPTPAWLAPWRAVREDKAGIVFYYLLQRRTVD
ncbi:16S rRNA (guanine(966)-N(2))-methyltransferase RsmD [Massilia sp. DWR3-1-1]|uniref:16S rRNA (guanine(966)-N(2))-methyltransferase RsmD n=1 Tax=Massilia sp. DWR3-1-1 TaxID=2804559 RepID=UPI003CF4F23D